MKSEKVITRTWEEVTAEACGGEGNQGEHRKHITHRVRGQFKVRRCRGGRGDMEK